MRWFIVSSLFLLFLPLVLSLPHPDYPLFSAAEHGFAISGLSLGVSDDAVYRTAYYSVNGSDWDGFSLSGSAFPGNSSWLAVTGSYSLPVALSGVGEHYVIAYSCSLTDNVWDCHDGKWQLIVINNSDDGSATIPFDGGCGEISCAADEYCSNDVCLLTVPGETYFVATTGNDNNPGSFEQPWKTWQKAVQMARPGDIVYIRGGIWTPTSHILTSGGYDTGAIAMGIEPSRDGFGASGTEEAPIRYYNYPGETPIMDGRLLLPNADGWQSGISMTGVEYIYLKGLTVRNIFQRPPDQSQPKPYSEVFGVGSFDSANLRFENMVVHNINGRGFQHWGGAWSESDGPNPRFDYDNTSWINCDAYNLFDLYDDTPGNAADGWKVVGYPANYYYWEGCRAWNYSDDGFDPNGAHRFFKNCWAMSTHYYQDLFDDGSSGTWDPEGNGFKISGVDPNYPGYEVGGEVFVRMENCIAAYCVGSGVANNIEVNYDSLWPNNGVFYNNIAYRTYGGFFDLGANRGATSRSTEYRNNIAFGSTYNDMGMYPMYEVGIYRPSIYPHSHNTWIGTMEVDGWPGWEYNPDYEVTDADFASVVASQLTAPRKADGSLPDITFLHLAPISDLIDGGVVVPGYHCSTVGAHPDDDCVEWYGEAPDLGPFEYVE